MSLDPFSDSFGQIPLKYAYKIGFIAPVFEPDKSVSFLFEVIFGKTPYPVGLLNSIFKWPTSRATIM